jgi:hypothetical protein
LPKAIRTDDLAIEFGFEVVDGGSAGFDFSDNLVLFGEGRKWESNALDFSPVKAGSSYAVYMFLGSDTNRIRIKREQGKLRVNMWFKYFKPYAVSLYNCRANGLRDSTSLMRRDSKRADEQVAWKYAMIFERLEMFFRNVSILVFKYAVADILKTKHSWS